MKELKKIAAIGGAIVLVACWPLAVGQIAQNVLTDGVKKLNNDDYAAEIISYERGYLSTTAVTRYSVKNPELKEQLLMDGIPTEITLDHQIKHGLFRIAAETTPVDLEYIPAKLSTITQLNGNTEFVLNLDNINYVPESGEGAIYIGKSVIEGSGTVLGNMDLSYRFPSMQFAFDNNETISFSNITGSATGKKVNQFWLGEQTISIENIAMLTADGVTVSDGNDISYKFTSKTNEAGDRIETNHIVSTGEIVSPDGALKKFDINFSLGGLDTISFESLVSTYQNNPVLTEQVLADSAPQIDTLFEKGFYLSMNVFQLELAEGMFDSKWRIEIPEGTQNITQNISQAIPVLTGKVDTFVSNDLVEAYPAIHQGIDELVVMDYMSKEADGYQIDAQVVDGNVVFVSGEKLPLIALLMGGMLR